MCRLPELCTKYLDVRRFLLMLLIVQLGAGNIIGTELMKVPSLVRHYYLHQAKSGNTGGWDFLRLHYARSGHREADAAHRQLPFHSNSSPNGSVMMLPDGVCAVVASPPEPALIRLPGTQNAMLPSDFRSGLLRPPC